MIYGPLYELEPQLLEAGYTLAGNKELANKLHFGLNICHIHGILSDGEYKKALGRLNKWVGQHAKPVEKEGEP